MRTSVFLFVAFFFATMASADISDFQSVHPTTAAHYKLVRTSVDAERYHAKKLYTFVANITLPATPDYEKARARLQKAEPIDRAILNDSLSLMDTVENYMIPRDELCMYDFKDGDDSESGFLIIRGQEIVKKWATMQDIKTGKPNKAPNRTAPSVTPPATQEPRH